MASLGTLIRDRRLRVGLTVRQLAQKAGFSASFVSQVERSRTNPSLSALKRIAEALDIPLHSFFQPEDGPPSREVVLVRRQDRKVLIYPGSNIRNELLSHDLKRRIEFLSVTAPPGARSGKYAFQHDGEECALVLKGRLELTIGDEKYLLNEGDSIYFKSSTPHWWRNVGRKWLHAIWALSPPTF